MSPHKGVWGGAAAANEIPCILVEISPFPGILEPFFFGNIRMKYRIKTVIVTCKISFILYDFIGFRSWAYYPLYLEMLFM